MEPQSSAAAAGGQDIHFNCLFDVHFTLKSLISAFISSRFIISTTLFPDDETDVKSAPMAPNKTGETLKKAFQMLILPDEREDPPFVVENL